METFRHPPPLPDPRQGLQRDPERLLRGAVAGHQASHGPRQDHTQPQARSIFEVFFLSVLYHCFLTGKKCLALQMC